MNRDAQRVTGLVLALSGPIIWAAHFFVVYGLEATVCTRASSPKLAMQFVVAVATTLAIGVLAAFITWRFRVPPENQDARAFLYRISIALALISIGAVLAVAASAVHLSACAHPSG